VARAETVLLTAFEPFGGDSVNASELAARPLEGRVIAGHRVSVAILPCRFGASVEALRAAIEREAPTLVVACGEAGGRAEISIERVAINVDDARIPDNAGAQPIDVPVIDGGPAAYWSTLPIKAIALALAEAGIPAAVSQTAGTFVCNHAFYALMHALAEQPAVRAGFVHVPCTPAQAKPRQPHMPTETTTRALEIVIATALITAQDTRIGRGATH
jgi:pyroglutamyl-peptidase